MNLIETMLRWIYPKPSLGCGLREETRRLHLAYPLYYAYTINVNVAARVYPVLSDRLRVLVGKSTTFLGAMAERAERDGIPYDALGYNLERTSPDDEWQSPVDAITRARSVADERGKKLLLGLGGRLADDIVDQWGDIAPLCDYWIVQAQRLQAHPPGRTFRREVNWRLAKLHYCNPEMKKIVQISVTPGPYQLEPRKVVSYANWLRGLDLDAVSIFDGRDPDSPKNLHQVLAAWHGYE